MRAFSLLAILLFSLLSGCLTLGSEDHVPSFRWATVHDPSVTKVGDTFYVFGSHLQIAKSSDLMHWTQVNVGVYNNNPIIPNIFTELKETFEWAETNTLWAPHVIQLQDGRYYFYYCACRGDSPRSAMGIAVSDSIEGPYRNLGIILRSGYRPGEGMCEEGVPYDARIHPNVVDPHVFYDKEGNLWMVYGSYSGGIYILKLDPETGFPLPEQGYGKKLTGGNHSRIEGPFIFYSPDTGYYYLFLSFGGLDYRGGYNIRVARSKNPDGPYYDAEGHNMTDCYGPSFLEGNDPYIAPFGVKLVGNFTLSEGSIIDFRAFGYVSPGHNSAYYDPETGKYFIFFHTRFPGRGETYQIRVHQLFLNEDGWFVMAPFPYAGETIEELPLQEVVGEYQLVIHDKEMTNEIRKPVRIALNPDGTVTGAQTGEWEKKGHYITLKLDGEIYKGVALKQWHYSEKKWVTVFSALSQKGVSVWGIKTSE
ncbi:MAG TPA: arabinan endo-1,5-alpha-L-arabinosidase [Thermotoga sp.]|jgi:arabinan endo-1,5-alpha-L-arabinosidase|nr:glycoside hydrolase family 43 [Thermotoga sp. RQ2]CAD67954.1 hypothetical protein [Thermotoga sp. RQ2]HBF69144.1 arabinan endo-1,5-alpha-L-arabinosidase [Thermotoga sp.]